jgi:hypothetical protein
MPPDLTKISSLSSFDMARNRSIACRIIWVDHGISISWS